MMAEVATTKSGKMNGKKEVEEDLEEEDDDSMGSVKVDGDADSDDDDESEAIMMKYFRQGVKAHDHNHNNNTGSTKDASKVTHSEDDEILIMENCQTISKKTKRSKHNKKKLVHRREKDKETRKTIVEENRKERAKSFQDEEESEEMDAEAPAAAAAAEAASAAVASRTAEKEVTPELKAAVEELSKKFNEEKYVEVLKGILNFAKRYPRIRLANPILSADNSNILKLMGFDEDKGFLVKTLANKAFINTNIEYLELLITQTEMKGMKVYLDFSTLSTIGHNTNVHIENSRWRIGHAETIGRRPTMEDEVLVVGKYRGKDELVGVFDGHGGRNAAVVASQILPMILSDLLDKEFPDDPKKCLHEAFLRTHQQICRARLQSGTTALVLLAIGSRMYIAHAGDSRGVLCRSGKAVRLTEDHKPNHPEEKKRITKLGGKVVSGWGWFTKVYRVNGILSVARALGDEELQPYVTAEPTVSDFELTSSDRFVILGCDGVWDKVSDKKAVAIASKFKDPEKASEAVRDYAYKRGSTDNISVVVVYF